MWFHLYLKLIKQIMLQENISMKRVAHSLLTRCSKCLFRQRQEQWLKWEGEGIRILYTIYSFSVFFGFLFHHSHSVNLEGTEMQARAKYPWSVLQVKWALPREGSQEAVVTPVERLSSGRISVPVRENLEGRGLPSASALSVGPSEFSGHRASIWALQLPAPAPDRLGLAMPRYPHLSSC